MHPDEFQQRLDAQNGQCAICSSEIEGKNLHRDHDHQTGEWRGLLCRDCNLAIGLMRDDPDRMVAAAFYVVKNKDVLGSLAEQDELIREGDKGGARNLASLDLQGTHYEDMTTLGW